MSTASTPPSYPAPDGRSPGDSCPGRSSSSSRSWPVSRWRASGSSNAPRPYDSSDITSLVGTRVVCDVLGCLVREHAILHEPEYQKLCKEVDELLRREAAGVSVDTAP
jgi:hypothetical protein